jgi:hypothetical protein
MKKEILPAYKIFFHLHQYKKTIVNITKNGLAIMALAAATAGLMKEVMKFITDNKLSIPAYSNLAFLFLLE